MRARVILKTVRFAPWTDPDHPDDRLDSAYHGGIVLPDQRRIKP